MEEESNSSKLVIEGVEEEVSFYSLEDGIVMIKFLSCIDFVGN